MAFPYTFPFFFDDVYVFLYNSEYIEGYSSTTRRLSVPSGKSAGNFQAGIITDYLNPLPSIDLGNNAFTELEWCIGLSPKVSSGDEIEFRVTVNGAPLDEYIYIPKWIIPTTGGGVLTIIMHHYKRMRS